MNQTYYYLPSYIGTEIINFLFINKQLFVDKEGKHNLAVKIAKKFSGNLAGNIKSFEIIILLNFLKQIIFQYYFNINDEHPY